MEGYYTHFDVRKIKRVKSAIRFFGFLLTAAVLLSLSAVLPMATASDEAEDNTARVSSEEEMQESETIKSTIRSQEESVDMASLFQAATFTPETGKPLNYRIYVPADYSEEKSYPLILFLHGAGQAGDDNFSQVKVGISEPFKNRESEIYHCIVLAPQCPGGKKWVDVLDWSDCVYSTKSIPESKVMAAVVELLEKTMETYRVDTDRVYVTGLSMGGYGTWDLLVRHGELFAAAIPVCGGADFKKAKLVKDIPIWTFHGSEDDIVPPTGTEKMVAAIRALNGNCQYTVYEGQGHAIWPDVYAREDLFPWLLSQKLSDRSATTEEPATQTPATTDALPATQAQTKKKGCGATVGSAGAALSAAMLTGAAFARKKKEND